MIVQGKLCTGAGGAGGRASNLIGESVISKLRDEDDKC